MKHSTIKRNVIPEVEAGFEPAEALPDLLCVHPIQFHSIPLHSIVLNHIIVYCCMFHLIYTSYYIT